MHGKYKKYDKLKFILLFIENLEQNINLKIDSIKL